MNAFFEAVVTFELKNTCYLQIKWTHKFVTMFSKWFTHTVNEKTASCITGANKKERGKKKVIFIDTVRYKTCSCRISASCSGENRLSLSFTGLLHVRQVPHLNCLASKLPDHKDLAFKLKRKQFSIEVCCQGYPAYPSFPINTAQCSMVLLLCCILNVYLSGRFFFVLFCCPSFILQMFFFTCHVTINQKHGWNLDANYLWRKPLHFLPFIMLALLKISDEREDSPVGQVLPAWVYFGPLLGVKIKGETIDYTLLLPHIVWCDVKRRQSVKNVYLYSWICSLKKHVAVYGSCIYILIDR